LVTPDEGARYLRINVWAFRELIQAGTIRRVSVPMPVDRRGRRAAEGRLRRVLVDLRDLDELVDQWKAAGREHRP
jgi:hypothetical protein